MAEPTSFGLCTAADSNTGTADPPATPTNAPTDSVPPPITLLTLPPDILTTIAHKAHPTARLVCAALAAASPPITAVCPTPLPPPASFLPALSSLCHRHARTVTALDLSRVTPTSPHPPPPFLALAAALPCLASLTIRHCPGLCTATHALPPLFALPHLTHLDINDCQGCIGVNELQNLTDSATALRSLSLEISTSIITNQPGPPAITSLSHLQSLTRLRLTTDYHYFPDGPPPSVMALLLDATARLPALQSLSLRKSLWFKSSWAVQQLLCRHTMLTELHIRFCEGEDDVTGSHAMAALRLLGAGLRRLSITPEFQFLGKELLDACLGCLTGLQALRLHNLETRQYRLCDLPALQRLTGLTALQLFTTAPVEGQEDLQVLLPLAGHLRSLELRQFYLDEMCLPGLARLTALTKLALIAEQLVTLNDTDQLVSVERAPEGLQAAANELQLSTLRALRVLHLEYGVARWVARCPEVAMATFGPLTSLTALTVDRCDLKGDVLAAGWLATMRQLETLAIDANLSTLTGAGRQALFALPRLRELALPVVSLMQLQLLKQLVAAAPAPWLLRVRLLRSMMVPYIDRHKNLLAIHELLGEYGITAVATPDDPDL